MEMPLAFLSGQAQPGMGLGRLDPAQWLWRDEAFDAEMREREALMRDRLGEVHAMLEGAEAAARELLGMILAHLAAHHPEARRGVDPGDPLPLRAAGRLVQEDLCLMQPGADGGYRLTAAILCFPAHWWLKEKIGRPLRDIHAPVPGFAERLLGPVERVFAGLAPERPVQRANWSVVESPELFHPHARQPAEGLSARNAGERLWLRVERQTLRRLPETGAVAFTIRTLVEPLARAAGEPAVARGLAQALRALDPAMAAYKGLPAILGPLLAWLDREADARAVDAQEFAAG